MRVKMDTIMNELVIHMIGDFGAQTLFERLLLGDLHEPSDGAHCPDSSSNDDVPESRGETSARRYLALASGRVFSRCLGSLGGWGSIGIV